MMIEFAIVAVVLYLLLASILTFGRLIFVAQTTTTAVDSAARELARTPLPAAITFEEVRDSVNQFSTSVYSEDYLAINITPWLAAPGGLSLLEYLDSISIPQVNRQLVPVMMIQPVGPVTLLRYPGTLVESATAPSGYSVVIPLVQSLDVDGNTTIKLVPVLEEIDTEELASDNTGASPDPFSINSAERGLVALRMNYPYQSVEMQGTINKKSITADDSLVTVTNLGSYTVVDPGQTSGPMAGQYGLGVQLSWMQQLRPFRRVVSTQAIYPRELFE
ncbi:MAG: TadE/TadG family type IV pilus assembly protein [Sumerlaeia bacterium]